MSKRASPCFCEQLKPGLVCAFVQPGQSLQNHLTLLSEYIDKEWTDYGYSHIPLFFKGETRFLSQ